jgi:hypothetical protein
MVTKMDKLFERYVENAVQLSTYKVASYELIYMHRKNEKHI